MHDLIRDVMFSFLVGTFMFVTKMDDFKPSTNLIGATFTFLTCMGLLWLLGLIAKLLVGP